MAGAMNEVIAVACLLDVSASRPVHFPSGNRAASIDGIENGLYSGVACVANNVKDFVHAGRRSSADESHPGNVVVHRSGCVFLAPDIEKDEIAFANRYRVARVRLV